MLVSAHTCLHTQRQKYNMKPRNCSPVKRNKKETAPTHFFFSRNNLFFFLPNVFHTSSLSPECDRWLDRAGIRGKSTESAKVFFFFNWINLSVDMSQICEHSSETQQFLPPLRPAKSHFPNCLVCGGRGEKTSEKRLSATFLADIRAQLEPYRKKYHYC